MLPQEIETTEPVAVDSIGREFIVRADLTYRLVGGFHAHFISWSIQRKKRARPGNLAFGE